MDRFRFILEEARTGKILAYDLKVRQPQLMRKLSGPSAIEFMLDARDTSVWTEDGKPIVLKPWGHWCHVEKDDKIWASGLFQPSDIDPKTGMLQARFQGFSNYPSKIPWLEDWNPIAVDPFEIFRRVWKHLQSYPNGDLGVEVYPDFSGTQMLPGFSFDGDKFVQDFFAIFIRAVDFVDCGDYLNKLARDIPFDFFEESSWNENHTAINKKIRLAYPRGGVDQENLLFQFGTNVIEGKSKIESEVQWVSDLIIRGWFPGKVYSSQLENADPMRYRRVIMEEDVFLNSDERTAAWSKRQLQRRQFPRQWESIIVNMYHSNAPFGTYDVGDTILIEGEMPWYGKISEPHKILAISVDEETSTCELMVKAEGAFNYDPIVYVP